MMNIQTVAENLRNTIAGKEQLVAHYREVAANQGTPGNINLVIATFVQDNIDELRRILGDVEQCMEKVEEWLQLTDFLRNKKP